jgi:putative hemolysin
MNPQVFLYGAFLLFFLLMSAFFSGSETAFFSLNLLERDKLRRRFSGKRGGFIADILKSPENILITILTGNMFVNLFFASLMDRLVERLVEQDSWLYSIVVGTALVLIFGEMMPKNIAIRHSLPFFSFASRPLRYIHLILNPARKIIQTIERGIVNFMSSHIEQEDEDTKIMITSTLQVALKKGIIHPSELEVLESFLDFREKIARDIMIPRTELSGVDIGDGLKGVLDELKALEKHRDRVTVELIPVYHHDLDHLEGYLNVQDILPYRFGIKDESIFPQVVRPIHPVPERKNLLDLLREMIESDRAVALVVDEYGGTAGIVTFQHLIEDFLRFFYRAGGQRHREVSEGVYLIPGDYDLEDLEQLLGVEFHSENRTLAGLIIERLGEIPVRGKRVGIAGHLFVIRRVTKNRILEVEVRKTE